MQNRIKQEWYLDNPHQWCDEVIGKDIYGLHMRHQAKWRGFTDFQIAFMRDITDLKVPIIYANCNRGGSKTMLTGYSSCCLLDNLDNYRISVLAGSKKQASTCYKYCRDVFERTAMSEKIKGETTQTNTNLISGGGMEILTASEKSTRSERTDMVIIDEACSGKSSLLQSVFGQAITATNIKIVILTTPDKLTHIAKKWWDDAKNLGIIKYQWGAYECNWISRKNIEILKKIYDEATFRIEMLGLWAARSGSVFRYEDIQKSLCNMSDLPPTSEIDRFFLGIDWGDAHETVATVVGLQGSPADYTDQWFIYAVKSWKREYLERMMADIVDLCMIFTPTIISEQSAISAYSNRELKKELTDLGLIFKQESFSKKKHRVVNNLKARLEKGKVKIPRKFKKTIEQLTNYSYKMVNDEVRDDFQKGNDDYVDSLLWSHWGIHHSIGRIETIGEWNF